MSRFGRRPPSSRPKRRSLSPARPARQVDASLHFQASRLPSALPTQSKKGKNQRNRPNCEARQPRSWPNLTRTCEPARRNFAGRLFCPDGYFAESGGYADRQAVCYALSSSASVLLVWAIVRPEIPNGVFYVALARSTASKVNVNPRKGAPR